MIENKYSQTEMIKTIFLSNNQIILLCFKEDNNNDLIESVTSSSQMNHWSLKHYKTKKDIAIIYRRDQNKV